MAQGDRNHFRVTEMSYRKLSIADSAVAGLISKVQESVLVKIKKELYRTLAGGSMETEKKFNKRAFVSVGMFLSGIGLPFSGIMNHYLGFDELTVARHAWMSVHNVLGLFFVIFSIMHVSMNWKPLTNAIKKHSSLFLSKEALCAAILILGFTVLFVIHAFHVRG